NQEEQYKYTDQHASTKDFSHHMKGSFLYATDKINTWVGEQEKVDLNLKDIFSNVFKKHTKQEAELIFISGTSFTTPKEEDISSTWPKPWLFSRIFITLALTYLFLFIAMDIFQNIYALPGLMVIGSFAVPFSLLIFFWEMNAPQNISFYENSIMFFVGGAASIPATLILYSIFPVYDLTFSAAICAGFAAFESAGYAFTSELFGDYGMTNVIFLRAWTGIGTHTIWSAIAGAALVYVKEDKKLTSNHIFSNKFIRLFAVSMILHAVWDMPLYALQNFYLQYIILIVIGWIFIFVLINAGLKQIVRINSVSHQKELVERESNEKMTES